MRLLTNAAQETAASFTAGMFKVDPGLPLTIAHMRHKDMEATFGGQDATLLTFVLSEGHYIERRLGGVWTKKHSRIGNITVADPDEQAEFAIRGQTNVVKLLIPMTGLAAAAGLNHRPNVIPRFGDPEPELGRCAQRALVALHAGDGADPLLLSSIVMRIHARLLEQPSSSGGRAVGGLARRQMRRVQELIEARASASIASSPTLAELAAEAGLSVHHFAREFRRSAGVAPYAYMLRRRLDRARQLVVQSTLPFARVGALTGFPSAAHFSDRFRREMGVSPAALRRAAQW